MRCVRAKHRLFFLCPPLIFSMQVVVKSGSKDVVVENCSFIHSSGATVGSIWYGNVSNVTYRNIYMQGSKHGARVKARGAGNATISDIRFQNIHVDGAQVAISVDMCVLPFCARYSRFVC